MEPGKCENALSEMESMDTETSVDAPVAFTIPKDEFGCGTLDSAYSPQMWRDMGKLFQQETLSDVMLMAEGQSIPCHKFHLAVASEYFYDRLAVASDAVNHNLMEIEGISFHTLKIIVSYLYTGNINITVENAGDVIPACKILKLNSAFATCEAFLLENISPQNCIGLHRVASESNIQALREKTRDVMLNDFKEVVSGPEFQEMSLAGIEEYIKSQDLNIPNEDPVCDAVLSWIKFHPDERSRHFHQLVKSVRFRFCSIYYLKYILPKEPLLETVENQKRLLSALKHQSSDGFCWDKVHSECQECSISPRKCYGSKASMMIIGGCSDPGDVTRTECWQLSGKDWKVREECPIPTAIRMFSACTGIDSVVVTGGTYGGKVISRCWLLSTATYQWSPLPDMNTPRARHASVCVAGQPYVIGGEGADEEELCIIERLEQKNRYWEFLPALPEAVIYPLAVCYGQQIYVFGGTDVKGRKDSMSGYVFSLKSNRWQKVQDMPGICRYGSAVVWKDIFYLVGGFEQSCMSFNPALNVWTTLSRCQHQHADGPALVWKDRILVCGGRQNVPSGTLVDTDDGEEEWEEDGTAGTSVIEEYDPETDTWAVSHIELPHRLDSHFIFCTSSTGI